ncbi:DUF1433 domain-containing protein [Guptibacillus hwajinpoensis]|uniref:DUF1433 domain-containing protein n=1 Tax=Guptibacillus hwajinpoensis TaxID=208199 RepID=UPI001CD57B91|nr:DUF1433 domain-containing protein [Pseudalkalibacillus hwajinpoensis]MCA0993510.1 DUF1433 domain-containing protein [Pseudalkalibacillus hwajinpoensis]
MKKINGIILLSIILLGGCNVNSSNQTYDNNTIEKARESVESYFRNNYDNVEKIKFSEDTDDPMGGLMINGTINGADFSASVNPEDFTVNSVGETEGFPEVKKECQEKVCDY